MQHISESFTCDYVFMWSTRRCERQAEVRVFRGHGAGENPVYKDRCLRHAAGEFGHKIAAWWDSEDLEWKPTY